ncbi:MAG: carboxypeptidase-like regulatory domain-containing protein [Acidobacteriota bacterium]
MAKAIRLASARILLLALVALCVGVPDLLAQPGGGGGQGRQRPQVPARGGGPPRAEELPKGTSILRGQVVTADTGAPVRRAQVRASSSTGGGRDGRMTLTDADGRFEIKELPAGRYTLTVSKGGYVTLQYGQRRPGESGTPLDLGDNERLDKLIVALPRGSVVAGRITDEFGEPVTNAMVTAFRYAYVAGARRLLPAPGQNARGMTDDRGEYRLFGLSPGEYVVAATLRTPGGENADPDAEVTGYAPTYYPGTGNAAEAQRVTVGLGQEQSNVSFGLLVTRLVRVSGTVMTSQGLPYDGPGAVILTPTGTGGPRGGGMMMQAGGSRLEAGGRFRIASVAPGRYTLQVRMMGPMGANAEFARQDLVVGTEDIDGLAIVTQPPARVAGQIVADGGTPPTITPRQVQIGWRSANPDTAVLPGIGGTTRPSDDWRFELTGLVDAGLFRATLPDGWALKSVTLNGQDVTDTPMEFAPGSASGGLEIVITQKVATVSGMVTDDRGRAVLDATVVVFPSDERLWTYQSRFIRAARPDQDGRYLLKGLPPRDDYLAIAVQGLEDGQAGDPDFLARMREAAARFRLTEGETRTLDVHLSQAR